MKDSEPACIQIDANVILRYILQDNVVLSPKADAVFAGLDAGDYEIECDPVTIAEAVWVLKSFYKATRQNIVTSIEPIIQSPGLRMPNKDRYLNALSLFATSVTNYGDACCCAAALEKCGGRLFSFDRELTGVPGIERLEEPPSITNPPSTIP